MAYNIFMKIEGLSGESMDEKYYKWSSVHSYSHRVAHPLPDPSTNGGETIDPPEFGGMIVVKQIDTVTPNINIMCAMGEHIPRVTLELCLKSGDKPTLMKYTLENCTIVLLQTGGTESDPTKPMEHITFNYRKITWEYTPIDHTGKPTGQSIKRAWDVTANKQV